MKENKMKKNLRRGFTISELIVVLGGLASLVLMVVLLVALFHFVVKYW